MSKFVEKILWQVNFGLKKDTLIYHQFVWSNIYIFSYNIIHHLKECVIINIAGLVASKITLAWVWRSDRNFKRKTDFSIQKTKCNENDLRKINLIKFSNGAPLAAQY